LKEIYVRFNGQIVRYPVFKETKGVRDMEFEFVWVRGHVEVYDAAGRFCFSADNMREAREELEEIA